MKKICVNHRIVKVNVYHRFYIRQGSTETCEHQTYFDLKKTVYMTWMARVVANPKSIPFPAILVVYEPKQVKLVNLISTFF